jgi:hypothetical protein
VAVSRALAVGNAPITPARQAAITSSGPDTRSIGAAITGIRNRLLIDSGNPINFPTNSP